LPALRRNHESPGLLRLAERVAYFIGSANGPLRTLTVRPPSGNVNSLLIVYNLDTPGRVRADRGAGGVLHPANLAIR
jgi:hypothetical protein